MDLNIYFSLYLSFSLAPSVSRFCSLSLSSTFSDLDEWPSLHSDSATNRLDACELTEHKRKLKKTWINHPADLIKSCKTSNSSSKYIYQTRRNVKKLILFERKKGKDMTFYVLLLITPARNPSVIKILVRNNLMDKEPREKNLTNGNIQQLPIFSQRSKKSLNPCIRSGYFPSKSVTWNENILKQHDFNKWQQHLSLPSTSKGQFIRLKTTAISTIKLEYIYRTFTNSIGQKIASVYIYTLDKQVITLVL